MDTTQGTIREGMEVFDADGDKLGKVASFDPGGFVIEKGLFFPRDHFARMADVREIRGDEVHLAVKRDALLPVEDRNKLEERGEWAARGTVPGSDAIGAPVLDSTIRNPALEDEDVDVAPPRSPGVVVEALEPRAARPRDDDDDERR